MVSRRKCGQLVLFAVMALAVFNLTGCGIFAPLIQSARSVGVTPSDRRNLLPEELAKFNNALYWGSFDDALSRTLPEAREEILTQIRKNRELERLVESKVDYIDYAEDAYSAKVEITTKYYRVPFYVVTDRNEQQTWKFTISGGWKLSARTIKAS